MSDKPIAVGDLVQVVRSTHECGNQFIGWVFIAVEILPKQLATCSHCNKPSITNEVSVWGKHSRRFGFPLSWLKRIDPPAEGETIGAYIGLPTKKRAAA